MARIVFFSFHGHGHINPTIGVVKELIKKGEEVYYYSIDIFREKIEKTGAIFKKYNRLEHYARPEEVDDLVNKDIAYGQFVIPDINIVFEEFYRKDLEETKVLVEDLLEEIKDLNPNYIIHDSVAYWGKQIARRLGIPAICSVTAFAYTNKVFDTHPQFVIKDLLHLDDKYLINIKKTKQEINKISEEYQKRYEIIDFDFLDIYSCYEELNIVYTSKYFQIFGELFNESYKFVGPSISERQESVNFPFESIENKKIICISLGTIFSKNVEFYKKCFKAFGDMEERIVVSVGDRINIEELGKIPENFIVKKYIPQIELLKRCEIFITHGGMNSTNEGLYFGVPLIIIPQGFEQSIVANRVEKLGAGIHIKDSNIGYKELKDSVQKIYSDKNYRKNSELIKKEHRNAGGYLKAVKEIFDFKEKNGII